MGIIEKIESLGYKVTKEAEKSFHKRIDHFLQIETPSGEKHIVPMTMETEIAIGCGNPKTMDEAKKNAENGIGIVVTADEIYRAVYAPSATEYEWTFFKSKYEDRRTFDALIAEEKRLSVREFGEEDCGDGHDFVQGTKTLLDCFALIDVYYGKLPDGTYCAEYVSARDIDSYLLEWVIFDKDVDVDTVKTAIYLRSIEKRLGRKIPENFRCWECGCNTFWLDAGKDIYKAAENAEDRYCGC